MKNFVNNVVVICVVLAMVCPLQAAVLTVSASDPVVDEADIALLPSDPGVTTVNDNESWTAVWAVDQPHQGQTFTTGADPAGYSLSAVSLLHNYYNIGFVWTDTGPWDILIGTIDGSGNLNVIAQETIPLGTTDGFTSSDGVADWMTWTLDTRVTLAANTTYAFAVGINNGGVLIHSGAIFVRTDDIGDYTGGVPFSDSVAGNGFDNPVVSYGYFQRIFHVDVVGLGALATNPDPGDNQDGVALTTDLKWNNPCDYTATKFVLKICADDPNWPGATVVDPVVDLNLDGDPNTTEAAVPVTLDPYRWYYWRVDSYEPGTPDILHQGQVWSFRTEPVDPVITADPANATAQSGTAVITVEAVDTPGTDSYHWKHNGSFVTATSVDEGSSETNGDYTVDCTVSGQSTLTIANVSFADGDEGTVSCVVSNDLSPNTPESADAALMSERLVGWWKLDGDLTDSVTDEVPGAPTHIGASNNPSAFTSAKDVSGLSIDGSDPNQIVTIANSNDFNFYPQGYTVSAWVKTTNPDNYWGAFVSKQKIDLSPSSGFLLMHNSDGQATHVLRQSFVDLISGVEVDDDQWHLVTGTYDGTTGEGKVYVDGVIANQVTNPGVPTTHSDPLIFGAELPDGTSPYIGLMDDVRIYSYPLGGVAIAELYTNFNPGEWVCVGGSGSVEGDVTGPEGTPDCRIDLYDLALFAQTWLDCNRFPASYCN